MRINNFLQRAAKLLVPVVSRQWEQNIWKKNTSPKIKYLFIIGICLGITFFFSKENSGVFIEIKV